MQFLGGYPLAVGHDPGFTYPIFDADYSDGRQSADCRYSIPHGLVVVPDMSRITSFSSKIVQTEYELSKSLSVPANVRGEGWGVSFSASAGYKESSTDLATGKWVFIFSTAKCIYYFSKLIADDLPPFSNSFLEWVYKLNNTEAKDVYLDFFEFYGTHFLSYVTFGARFTYEHKMNSTKFKSERKRGIIIAVEAGYSGSFSVGGGFLMDLSQKQKASNFAKNVDTKTISVGAPPPANGDALTWASTVKENPVPMEYVLDSIERLFTEKYMRSINVNYTRIPENIERFKIGYATFLKEKGEFNSTKESLRPRIVLFKTELHRDYESIKLSSTECINHCLEKNDCVFISYCKTCSEDKKVCKICTEKDINDEEKIIINPTVHKKREFESIVFVSKIERHS